MLSAEHTSRFLVPFLRWIDPQISLAALNAIQLGIRKLGHLTEYAILAMLLWRALRGGIRWQNEDVDLVSRRRSRQRNLCASDEFHQSFVPSRTGSPNDVMIDICGALIGPAYLFGVAACRRSEIK